MVLRFSLNVTYRPSQDFMSILETKVDQRQNFPISQKIADSTTLITMQVTIGK
jgi:hypothetical protein